MRSAIGAEAEPRRQHAGGAANCFSELSHTFRSVAGGQAADADRGHHLPGVIADRRADGGNADGHVLVAHHEAATTRGFGIGEQGVWRRDRMFRETGQRRALRIRRQLAFGEPGEEGPRGRAAMQRLALADMLCKEADAVAGADAVETQGLVAIANAQEGGLPCLFNERGQLGQCGPAKVELIVEPGAKLEQSHTDAVVPRVRIAIEITARFEDGDHTLDDSPREAGRGGQVSHRRLASIAEKDLEHVQGPVDRLTRGRSRPSVQRKDFSHDSGRRDADGQRKRGPRGCQTSRACGCKRLQRLIVLL
jgi:hypothetical protein